MFEIFYNYGVEIMKYFQRIYKKYFIKKINSERCAWLTLICTDDYLYGVLALIRLLKRSKTIYPLIVLIVEDNVLNETKQQING